MRGALTLPQPRAGGSGGKFVSPGPEGEDTAIPPVGECGEPGLCLSGGAAGPGCDCGCRRDTHTAGLPSLLGLRAAAGRV